MAQTKAHNLFDDLNQPDNGLIVRIAGNATAQQSTGGDFHGGTTDKHVLHDALMLELRGLNRSAAAIARENHSPGLMDHFRMPYGVDEETLAARARAFGLAATPLASQFEELGHESTFLADLEAHIQTFEDSDIVQNEGEERQAGATANFGPLIAEALDKVKTLDAIMHNFYKGNAVKLGEWKTASHVERQPKPTPPTPRFRSIFPSSDSNHPGHEDQNHTSARHPDPRTVGVTIHRPRAEAGHARHQLRPWHGPDG